MARPSSREEFKQYCLRKLGHPVIQINASDEQLEDRIVALEKRHDRLRTRGGRLQEELIDIHRDLAEARLELKSLLKSPPTMPGMPS